MMKLRSLLTLTTLILLYCSCRKEDSERNPDSDDPISLKAVEAAFSTISSDQPKENAAASNSIYNLPRWITPKNWNTLWSKYVEFSNNPNMFNTKLMAAEFRHSDFMAGLLDVFGDGINVLRSDAGQNNFVPYVRNSNAIGAAQPYPCN